MGTTLEKPTLTNLKEYPIADAFGLRKEEIAELEKQYMVLGIEPDGTGRDEVHTALMDVVNRRTSITKKGKELRKEPTAFCKRVLACEKQLVELMTPIEEHLRTARDKYDAEQERKKREAEERRQAAIKAKVEALADLGCVVTSYEVEAMSDVEYDERLGQAREEHAARLKREAAEKAERERKEAEEAEARRKEQERLAAERAKFELAQSRVSKLANVNCVMTIEQAGELTDEQFDETFANARKVHEAEIKRQADERAAQEAEAKRLREEREKLEAEKAKAEQEQREKEAADKAAQEERDRIEREKIEAQKAAEAAEAERKRQQALRPDREKIEALATQVLALEVPELTAENALDVQMLLRTCLASCADDLREVAGELK